MPIEQQTKQLKTGFTIIEVVLVLAIAGLIFLMVFVALPSLQRSQRDTQRRNDASRLATALKNYQTNNYGNLPQGHGATCYSGSQENDANASKITPNAPPNFGNSGGSADSKFICSFIARYLNSSTSSTNEFLDPIGVAYGLEMGNAGSTTPETIRGINYNNHKFYVKYYTKCSNDESTIVEITNNKTDYTITYRLEGSGTLCLDNQ